MTAGERGAMMHARIARAARARIARVAQAGAPLAAALALAGCIGLGGGKPPAQLIALTPASSAPAGAMAGGTLADALVVLDPDTDRRLDVLRVPVQVDDASVAYLKDAQWVERPARQFRRLLAEAIRARSGRMVLEGPNNETGAKAVLSGRLLDMGYDARKGSVVVRFDAVRRDAAGALQTRRFEAEVPGIPAKPVPVSAALNRAANDVARQVADWVG